MSTRGEGLPLRRKYIRLMGFLAPCGTLATVVALYWLKTLGTHHIVHILILAGGFALLSLFTRPLPSGLVLNPGVVLSTSSMFLLPPQLVVLACAPGVAIQTFRARRPWYAYLGSIGHGALGLIPGAMVYQALAPQGPPRLPDMLPGAFAALLVHEVMRLSISALLVAYREGRPVREQWRQIIGKDLNWGLVGLHLTSISVAVQYGGNHVWGLLLQTALLLCFCQTISYHTRMALWQQAAWTDGLTGVGNRAGWESYLATLKSRGRRLSGTLVVIDVDGLKALNDGFGHAEGDAALRDLAERLSQSLRRTDRLYRYGGDEFVAFLPHEPHNDGFVRERLTPVVEGFARDWAARGRPVRASVGFASIPAERADLSQLFALADARMYEAKQSRRMEGAG